MAANMRGPKPVDPLYYRWNDTLTVHCQHCPNWASATVRAWATWNRLDDRIRLSDMQRRMRCLRCGNYGPRMDLKEWGGP